MIRPGAVWITVIGLTRPVSIAQPMMNGFIVEPGSKVSVSARLRNCSPVSLAAVVGREARVVGQRQHLARLGVEHDHAAGLGLVLGDRIAHPLVGEELDLRIDRQRDVAAVQRGDAVADLLDHAAEPVLDHAAAAVAAGQFLLEREFDAFLAA